MVSAPCVVMSSLICHAFLLVVFHQFGLVSLPFPVSEPGSVALIMYPMLIACPACSCSCVVPGRIVGLCFNNHGVSSACTHAFSHLQCFHAVCMPRGCLSGA